MVGTGFEAAFIRRSVQNVKTELEFLESTGHISSSVLQNVLAQLGQASNGSGIGQPLSTVNFGGVANRAPEEQHVPAYVVPSGPPPGYHNEPEQTEYPSEKAQVGGAGYQQADVQIATGIALYDYNSEDPGDLKLRRDDRICVIRHENAEWSFGRNERTKEQGIFPRSYARLVEEGGSGQQDRQQQQQYGGYGPNAGQQQVQQYNQPSSYGNMPMQVTEGQPPQDNGAPPGKGAEMGKKIGKKLGNAAIFGAGATIGSNIVNSIF